MRNTSPDKKAGDLRQLTVVLQLILERGETFDDAIAFFDLCILGRRELGDGPVHVVYRTRLLDECHVSPLSGLVERNLRREVSSTIMTGQRSRADMYANDVSSDVCDGAV